MSRLRPSRLLVALALLLGVGGCRGSTDPDPLVGTFMAAVFRIAPSGQAPANILAAGGTIGVNIAVVDTQYVATGTLVIPAAANGGTTLVVSLAGTVTRSGDVVRFVPDAGSVIGDLAFTLAEPGLVAPAQVVNGVTYEVELARQ